MASSLIALRKLLAGLLLSGVSASVLAASLSISPVVVKLDEKTRTAAITGAAVAVQLMAFSVTFHSAAGGTLAFAEVLSIAAIAGIVLMTLPLMMVAVGVQFIIATVTRSFKEAQTYLGLLPLVPAIPGMVLVFAPVQAKAWMMMIPAFSQTLLLGAFVRGETLPMADVALSMSSSLVAALALIAVSAHLYDREKLIFGG